MTKNLGRSEKIWGDKKKVWAISYSKKIPMFLSKTLEQNQKEYENSYQNWRRAALRG